MRELQRINEIINILENNLSEEDFTKVMSLLVELLIISTPDMIDDIIKGLKGILKLKEISLQNDVKNDKDN